MEKADYRDNLEFLMAFFPGKGVLTIDDVRRFTGYKDARTIRRRFSITPAGDISVPTFARDLCSYKGARKQ